MFKFSQVALALAAMSMTLVSCAGAPSGPPRELHMTAEQIASSPVQNDIALMTMPTFDDDGNMLAAPPLTRTQAKITANAEKFCDAQGYERIQGKPGQMIQKAGIGAALFGLASFIGGVVLHLPIGMAARYGGAGAANGAASGAFTDLISVEQARSVFSSYCQLQVIGKLQSTGDRRLSNIIGVPLIGMASKRLPVDWKAVTLSSYQRCVKESGSNAQLAEHCKVEAAAANAAIDSNPPAPPPL